MSGAGPRARHRHRAIARQPVRPILVAGLQRLLDQQAAEARAIDEEIGLDLPAALERDRGDVAILVHADIDDLAFGALDPVLLGKAAQIFGVERGVELERVGDMADRRIPPCPARACMNLFASAAAVLIE